MSNKQEQKLVKFLIASDVHHGQKKWVEQTFGAERKHIDKALPLFKNFVKLANEENYDAVINMGDYVQSNNEKDDLKNLKIILEEHKKINSPLFLLTGNHEHRHLNFNQLKEVFNYDKFSYSVNIKAYHLVFIGEEFNAKNNTQNLDKLKLRNTYIDWLKADLKNNNLPCLVFSHYPIAEFSVDTTFWSKQKNFLYEHCFLSNPKEVFNIIDNDKNVIACFAGHQHITKTISNYNKKYYMLGSFSIGMINENKPDGIVFELVLNNDDFTVNTRYIEL